MDTRILLGAFAYATCILIGCSRQDAASPLAPSVNSEPAAAMTAATISSAPPPADSVDLWYRTSPVYVQGSGFVRCQQLQYIPAGLWGNSRRVKVAEHLSGDGVSLRLQASYLDNGETATILFFRNKDTCEQQKPERPRVKRGPGFTPFVLVSKSNEKLSSETIENEMMCRDPVENLELGVRLVKEFQIIRTGGDHSMSMVSFLGQRDGQPLEVTLATTTSPRRLAYVYAGADTAFSCD